MYTQCPECLSVFSLDVHTLAQAHGHVTCGHCQAGFDSIATLAEQLPPEPFVELPVNEPAFEPPCVDLVVYRPRLEPAVVVVDEAIASTSTTSEDFSQLVFAPRFARDKQAKRPHTTLETSRTRKPSQPGNRAWAVTCTVLALLLVAQLGWAERDQLMRNRTASNWLQQSCSLLGCDLPLVSAPQQLHLLASNVQAHPSARGALMISASVRNDAHFTQTYPVLVINLSNAQGQRIGMRRLKPRQYLDDGTILQRGLAPGASAVLLLEIEDPGNQAVSFELGFE